MINLRGHHLLCLLGYRGMGYSPEFVANMTLVHQTLRNNPKTRIQLVQGPDQLCAKCPESGEYHCQDDIISEMDAAVLKKLELKIGEIIEWGEIEKRIRKEIVPSDIQIICKNCSWRSYGVCEEGIQAIREGKSLMELP